MFILLSCPLFTIGCEQEEGCLELPTTTSEIDKRTNSIPMITLIASLEKIINTQYQQNTFFKLIGAMPQLSEKDMVTICNTVSMPCHNNEKWIPCVYTYLFDKNSFFKVAAQFFINKAIENMNIVTASTIDIINNHELEQPQTILNKLLPTIKKIFMNKAAEQNTWIYTMILAELTDTIDDFDIHALTGRVVTVSAKTKTARLWDLNAGGTGTIQHNSQYINISPRFNRVGSHIALVANFNTNTSLIEQWHINEKNLQKTHSQELDKPVNHISYCDDTSLIAVKIIDENIIPTSKRHQLTLVQFSKDGSTSSSNALSTCFNSTPDRTDKYDRTTIGPYTAQLDKNQLKVTKESSDLYLCVKAIHNTHDKTLLHTITESNTYQKRLTSYEQNIVMEKMSEKIKALTPRNNTNDKIVTIYQKQ